MCTKGSTTSQACLPHSTGAPPTSPSQHLRCAFCSFTPSQAARFPTSARRSPPLCPAWPEPLAHARLARPVLRLTPSSSSHQASPPPFDHPSRLKDAANAVAASREQSKQAAFVLSPGSPAAFNASVQPFGVFTAAVEPVIRSRRRSELAAAPSPTPHSSPNAKPVTAASAVPQPSARAAPAVAPPQTREHARPHAPLPSPDFPFSTERVAAPISPAGAAASSTPAPGPATHPIALSRAEYHARYAATHPPRGQKCEKRPKQATS